MPAIYVFSIVLAVGIGQMGRDSQEKCGREVLPDCTWANILPYDCPQMDGEEKCGYDYSGGDPMALGQRKYIDVSAYQCGSTNNEGKFERFILHNSFTSVQLFVRIFSLTCLHFKS